MWQYFSWNSSWVCKWWGMLQNRILWTNFIFSTSENVTNAPEDAVCSDKQPECVLWSLLDQCNLNPIWMLKHCKISCGVCQTSVITTTSVVMTTHHVTMTTESPAMSTYVHVIATQTPSRASQPADDPTKQPQVKGESGQFTDIFNDKSRYKQHAIKWKYIISYKLNNYVSISFL